MNRQDRTIHAQKRIAELQLLIKAWNPPEKVEGFAMTKEEFEKIKATTQTELRELFDAY